jgi:hypothetical protein
MCIGHNLQRGCSKGWQSPRLLGHIYKYKLNDICMNIYTRYILRNYWCL